MPRQATSYPMPAILAAVLLLGACSGGSSEEAPAAEQPVIPSTDDESATGEPILDAPAPLPSPEQDGTQSPSELDLATEQSTPQAPYSLTGSSIDLSTVTIPSASSTSTVNGVTTINYQGGDGTVLNGSGMPATRVLEYAGVISTVAVSGNQQFVFDPSLGNVIEITTDDNLIDSLLLSTQNGVLRYGYAAATVISRVPVHVRWGGAPPSVVLVSGVGDVFLPQVSGPSFSANISGTGDVHISGAVEILNVQVSGTGDFDGAALRAAQATALISGVGSVEVTVTNSVTGLVSGVGDVVVYGNPAVRDVGVSGSGTVLYADGAAAVGQIPIPPRPTIDQIFVGTTDIPENVPSEPTPTLDPVTPPIEPPSVDDVIPDVPVGYSRTTATCLEASERMLATVELGMSVEEVLSIVGRPVSINWNGTTWRYSHFNFTPELTFQTAPLGQEGPLSGLLTYDSGTQHCYRMNPGDYELIAAANNLAAEPVLNDYTDVVPSCVEAAARIQGLIQFSMSAEEVRRLVGKPRDTGPRGATWSYGPSSRSPSVLFEEVRVDGATVRGQVLGWHTNTVWCW